MRRFLIEIDRGLKKSTHDEANIKCFVTYVQDLPNGKGMCDIKKKLIKTIFQLIFILFFLIQQKKENFSP